MTISFKRFEAHKANQALDLSPREFRILKHFSEHRGAVITRDELLDAVWGYSSFPLTRTVDMHIAKLQQKIEDHPHDLHDLRHIITIHRVGYKFVV